MPRAKPWDEPANAELTRLFVEELMSIAMIARRMRRNEENIRQRILHLKLLRSPAKFQEKWDHRREAAKAAVAAARDSYVPPIANKDEDHWRRCRELGGFNVLIISYPPRRAA